MKKVEAACPSCGGPVEFKASASLVTVCPSCESVVARNDRNLEDHGKVAAIVATDSPFHIGKTGRFRDHPFEIIGHIQYQHPAGGVWDEWYGEFPNGAWCWIAEAQGKRYLTIKRDITSHVKLPAWEELKLNQVVSLGSDKEFKVAEFNTATVRGFAGELPVNLIPGSPHRFADLVGPKNGFATIAYGENEIELFRGTEVSLADLGISAATSSDSEPVQISGTAVSCPQCGGSLSLHAPDAAQRVTCPFCSSLLDVNQGSLTYLQTLSLQIQPLIPLGTSGTLRETKFTVIGFTQRSVRFDREYTWDEYLLYEPNVGFRWLVNSDRHWNFVEPITDTQLQPAKSLSFGGDDFRLFQQAWARVDYVLGEFYWKVSIGDLVYAEDYISPPRMISLELTPGGIVADQNLFGNCRGKTTFVEQIASLGTYLPHEKVEAAFQIGPLPRSSTIAPNQPGPNFTATYLTWPLMVGLLVLIDIIISGAVSTPVEHTWTWLAVFALSAYPIALWLYSSGVESSRWAESPLSNDNSADTSTDDSSDDSSDD